MSRLTLLFLVLLPCISAHAASAILVHGHRGARAMRPENTLPAFQYALEQGVDVLELDMDVTKDGEIVISHEPYITPERCLDSKGAHLTEKIAIHSLTLAEVQSYDCGSLPHSKFPKQELKPHTPMPRLKDRFAMVKASKQAAAAHVQFNIETKIFPAHPELTPTPEEFATLVVKILRAEGPDWEKSIILQSFDDRTLLAAKKLAPKLRTSMLTSDNHVDYVAVAKAAHADMVSPDNEWILPADVARLHRAHVQVAPWTVNEPKDWDRLMAMDVDAIISDDPAALLAYLRAHGRHP